MSKSERCPSVEDQEGYLFLGSLGSRLGDLAGTGSGLLNSLDDTDGDGLTHVTDGEATKGRIVGESLNAHGLRRNHLDDGGITRLDELRRSLNRLAGTAVDLLEELSKLAGDVSSVAIEDRGVASADLTGVVEDDDLGGERSGTHGGVVLGVTGNVATTNFLDGDVLHVEADIVARDTLGKLLVVHLDGLDFSGDVGRSESDDHAGLEDTGLDTADRNSSDTANLVHILEGKTERLVGGTLGGLNSINGLKEGLASDLATLDLLLPTLVPGALVGRLKHVVAVEAGDGDESDRLGVVADLLDEVGSLLDDFLVTGLRPVGRVHLVDSNDKLLDTEGVSEQSVLTSLAILGDTSLELTSTSGNDENGTISLGGTSDHVLNEIAMAGGIDDSDVVLGRLELPEGDIDGDTTLTLGLELVKNPGILEGALAELSGFLLELLNGTPVDTTALVDQVAGRSRLAGVDVADDHDVDVSFLLLAHFDGCLRCCGKVEQATCA
jgi:hypothetical protein